MAGIKGQTTEPSDNRGPTAGRSDKLVIPFDDNRLLAELLGEFDSHLALIEDRMGVEAVAHGNVITVSGPKARCEATRGVLQGLYRRLEDGHRISAGDVDGAIRIANSGTADRKRKSRTQGAPSDGPDKDGVPEIRTRKRLITARTPMQGRYIDALKASDLVFGQGPAGTGKTYLAVAYAAACLESGLTEKIILSRPAVEAGERLGFLPGDMKEKVDPYLRPLYDALYDVLPPEKVERGLETQVIEIAPLAFMRGRTLSHAYIILDEAQNCTSMQMKMFLTRLGEKSKMVVTGDPSQVDLPSGQKSGLIEAIELLKNIDDVDVIKFTGEDVVRRELVAKIVAAYDRAGEKNA